MRHDLAGSQVFVPVSFHGNCGKGKPMRKNSALGVAAIMSGLLLTSLATMASAQNSPESAAVRRPSPRQVWGAKALAVGDVAPDFELPRLDPFLRGEATSQSQLQTVRLSS